MGHETFWSLLQDPAHWAFELFLMFLFDVVIGAILWPRLKKWKSHHNSDDHKIEVLERQVKELQEQVKSLKPIG
jgi:hypothetical protein